MKISSFFLCTGQEVIAKIVNDEPDCYVVEKPLIIHMMHGQNGQPQLGFAPMSMIRKETAIRFYKHALMSPPTDVEEQVATSYIENTTGLALPPSTSGQILMG